MPYEAWYTLLVIALLTVALLSNRVGPDTAMLGALTLLIVGGVFGDDIQTAVAGFADPSVLMIAALFVVATGLNQTGAMELIAQRVLGRPKTLPGAQMRMMLPVCLMSAFMNNTPIVAMYLPIVHNWARKLKFSPSYLFMPLSFAAIIGGACTLIGTSTNIAVNQLYLDYFDANEALLVARHNLERPSTAKQFWWIAVVGAPVAILCLPFIMLTAKHLLPERKPPDSGAVEGRSYIVDVIVEEKGPLVGRTIEEAGLRQLPGLYLSEIEREGNLLPAVGPDEVLHANDRLVFAGMVESVVDLLRIRGLVPATDQVSKVEADRASRRVVEAVISHSSPLVRRTVREARFRTVYNAAIIAVHRNGQRIRRKIGDIILQPGDTLLLSTHSGFTEAYRNSDHFYLVSNVEEADEPRHDRAWIAIAIMALLVILLAVPLGPVFAWCNGTFGTTLPETGLHPLAAGLLCATLMVYTRCTTGTAARGAIGWQVLLVIGAALGIGKALHISGAAEGIASLLHGAADALDPHLLLFALSLFTTIVCQLITNKGAAVLMFPICMAISRDLELSPEPFVVTLMATAACSFLTPVGFVTNLMVYGPGGYRFTDYTRLGLPLTLIVATCCSIIAPAVFPF